MDTATIEHEALHLPVSDRARLAHKLLLSLEELSELEVEDAWFDEAERRAREIDDGLVQLIPAEEVSRKAREMLR
ncbi:MAG: addiction module antitoxin RelB [Candidatus Methylumidiphilus alinenensis]|uniref:Addiction module antitoxin RelB n=1 Tax=Candidatus Methylumidiphilus alinenensis TaxID=2202197 RepID=A0A2W4RU98_9GAMM|nr:MAG: addiction module antitoxin RelB [Candidatus Methylumidiphilus alinenensis]